LPARRIPMEDGSPCVPPARLRFAMPSRAWKQPRPCATGATPSMPYSSTVFGGVKTPHPCQAGLPRVSTAAYREPS
jgi:hypothetical protein